MTPVDLARLRKTRDACIVNSAVDFAALAVWHHDLSMAATHMMDELEEAREEVARLRATQEHPGYVATHSLVRQAYSDERAMVVAWLRVNGTGHLADCIERGDHHESAGK